MVGRSRGSAGLRRRDRHAATLPRWINHPTAIARAEYKPVQLTEAAACGMRIPRTLVTNDPREAKEFAETVGPTVHKRLSSAIGPGDPLTRLVDPSEIEIGNTAHLFQEWVPKAYEVRLTVVDDAFFAVRIDPTSPHVDVDWRADYDALHHTVIETPPAIRTAVAALMKRLGLRFAALDFAVTAAGDWIFFEINPNGQWAWLEDATGLPVASAIADALMG